MSAYADRPWLKLYDDHVDPDFLAPETSYLELIERSFSDFADRAALHFLGTTLSFRELDLASRRFAAFLHASGLEPGDVVGINMPNLPQYLIAQAGTLRAGCVANGVSPLLTPKEMAYQLNDNGAKALVTLDFIFAERVTKISDKVPRLSHLIVANLADFLPWPKRTLGRLLKKVPSGKVTPLPGKTVLRFNEVMAKYPAQAPAVKLKPDDTCLVQYTGGTTGMPKGAELTHRNMVNNLMAVAQWGQTERGGEILISAFPFFHLAGLAYGMSGMAMGNTQILIPDPRNIKHFISEFAKYRPTSVANVPSLYIMLMNDPAFKNLPFGQVKCYVSGAAPFAVESFRSFERIVGEDKVLEVYGMTETSPIMTSNPLRGPKRIGSVGLPIQSTFIKLMDLETGTREVQIGQEGEIVCRGPQVMKGYLNKPEETAHALRQMEGGKWLYTGDVARMDEDGFLTIVDRAKDMLNVGGYKVFSREVEESLYQVPAIEFCAIVGVSHPDRPGSEVVKAVIQLKPAYQDQDRDAIEREIRQYCEENMAPYKCPKSIEFTKAIPLTAVGKVDKKALR